MPAAEIITIGTEILLGEIVDTNTRHIALTLRNLGVDLYRTTTIGDNVGRIASAISEAVERAEIVITTGGLGPTVDDPTREAVAKSTGREVEFREDLWQQVVETITRYGRKPAENQKRQAFVPQGALSVRNPVGTAPAFIVEINNTSIISLPGVPNEMEHILHESVVPYLQKRYFLQQLIKVRVLHCSGLGEGMIDEKIGDLETLVNPTVGLAAHTGIVDVRITAKAASEGEADQLILNIENDIVNRLGNAVFGADEDTLEGVTLKAVTKRGWTVVFVETGLNGLLQSRLLHAISLSDEDPLVLIEAVRHAHTKYKVDVVLGIRTYAVENSAEMVMITPLGEKTHRITYGGPPRSLSLWSLNLALNWLRTTAKDSS